MNESKDPGHPSPTPDEPVSPADDSGSNAPSSSPARESIPDPFAEAYTLPRRDTASNADNTDRGSVNLDKPTASDSSPAASGASSGATGGDEGAGGRGDDSGPSEGYSEPPSEDSDDLIAFLPLGLTFIVLGTTMDNGIPFFAVGITFLVIYLSSTFKGESSGKDG